MASFYTSRPAWSPSRGAYPQQTFKLDVSVDGSHASDLGLAMQGRLEEEIAAAMDRLLDAYMASAAQVMRDYRGRLRADIEGGGFYKARQLSKTWRGSVYPQRRRSLEPAVYLATKNRTLIDVFTFATTITAHNARFLAIPVGPAKDIIRRFNRSVQTSRRSDVTGRDGAGRYASLGSMVARVEASLGVKLRAVISADGRHGVLIPQDSRRLTPTGRMARSQRGPGTPLFVLVRQATLRKRIEGHHLLSDLGGAFKADFTKALAANLPAEVR